MTTNEEGRMPAPSNSANGAMLSQVPTTIETYSGLFVDVAAPDPSTLRLADIAQGLALTCRYGGQVNRFYSVAEHAVLVHDLLGHEGADKPLLVAALFHDAPEAYLGDVVAPLKYAMRRGEARSTYDLFSDNMDDAIAERYGVDLDELNSPELRTADMWALRIEARSLTHSGGAHWRWPGELPNSGEKPGDVAWLGGRKPTSARLLWLDAVARLGITDDRVAAA